jgi:hypothetical protein
MPGPDAETFHSVIHNLESRTVGHGSVRLMQRHKQVGKRTLRSRLVDVSSNRFANVPLKWKLLDATTLSTLDRKSIVLPVEIL